MQLVLLWLLLAKLSHGRPHLLWLTALCDRMPLRVEHQLARYELRLLSWIERLLLLLSCKLSRRHLHVAALGEYDGVDVHAGLRLQERLGHITLVASHVAYFPPVAVMREDLGTERYHTSGRLNKWVQIEGLTHK